ncbi:non-ribosomal peptide synthetase [Streptomyces chrestomyceticus]|uniref:non-ribosomal peptide synthetase n=1 Tax=Streptomyces chrestomyceticus TaxID=68185 RepID=UPI0033E70936
MQSTVRHKVLTEFNGCPAPYPPDGSTTIDLIGRQARTTPTRTALVWEGGSLTYGELESTATTWAGALRAQGIGHGDLLPVLSHGGPQLAVAVLAAMKAAAPFVPVDATWPPARIRAALDTLHPGLVLCTGPAPADVRERWRCLEVPEPPSKPSSEPSLEPPSMSSAPAGPRPHPGTAPSRQDLAYGFFTSGSTGTPKCALNKHLGLLNRFLVMTRRFASDGGVVLQNSRHSFDSSLWQLLWPLTTGGRVVLPRHNGIVDLHRTVETIERHGVTMTDFVPSVFNTLVDLLVSDPALVPQLASLRRLLIGGEEISPRAVRAFRSLLPHVALTNTFGPTEASIGSVFHEVDEADGDTIPIGRPIENTYAVLLGENGEPVPPGETGEIHLGGDCLGTGYLDDPERTAAAFVPNPFPEIPGPLLYRTGDLGRHRPDGALLFKGRRDQQVKIGGVRLELTEVEAAVASHPQVREAKALVHDTGAGRALVCCVVAAEPLTPGVLRDHVRTALPGHSVPSRFVFLDRIPLTHNGKADRAALGRIVARRPPSPAPGGRSAPGGRTGPPSAHEALIAELWRDLLGLPADTRLSPHDDFHDLGGTSLHLQRLSAALRTRRGTSPAVGELATATTVREQAALLGRAAPRPGADRPSPAVLADIARAAGLPAPARRAAAGPPRQVLLSGATGFVGAHLLVELLERTDATVHCVVRAEGGSSALARRRLEEALGALGRGYDPARIRAVPGDLERPYLGLGEAAFGALAAAADTVVHAAAQVNLLLGYRALRRVNALGTLELLRLAAQGRAARFHHLSTLAVFPGPAGPRAGFPRSAGPRADRSYAPAIPSSAPVREEPPGEHVPAHGYGQSKWAAERMVLATRERGLPATVHRMGEVMPHSRTGHGNPRSALDRLLRACLRLRLRFPCDTVTDWTPVDHVARAVVTAVQDPVTEGIHHLVRPRGVRLDAVLGMLARRVPLRQVGYREFHRAVREAADAQDAAMGQLLAVLPDPAAARPVGPDRLFTDVSERFSTERAACLAERAGLDWGPATPEEIRPYLAALVADGGGSSASIRSA